MMGMPVSLLQMLGHEYVVQPQSSHLEISVRIFSVWVKSNRYPLNLRRQAQFWTALPLGWPGPQSVKAATLL